MTTSSSPFGPNPTDVTSVVSLSGSCSLPVAKSITAAPSTGYSYPTSSLVPSALNAAAATLQTPRSVRTSWPVFRSRTFIGSSPPTTTCVPSGVMTSASILHFSPWNWRTGAGGGGGGGGGSGNGFVVGGAPPGPVEGGVG